MTAEKKMFVVKAGSTFPDMAESLGDFEHWIIDGLGIRRDRITVVDAEKEKELPGPEMALGIVISGAHAMVTEEQGWSLALERWVREFVEAGAPVLGICYGHQILARAMGGAADYHPGGAEIGTVDIHCLPEAGEDVLFKTLPSVFKGHVVHSQTVTRLPEDAVLLARNEFEPHHAFRVGEHAWGVQFHPEFSIPATRGYVHHMTATIQNQGKDQDAILTSLEETPHASDLLRLFGRLAVGE
ncbi:MAG: glutamine amidotransferase [Desulfobacterales bacterium]|nr:glutamine amidotransferase [Desulfobacterales bacterium]